MIRRSGYLSLLGLFLLVAAYLAFTSYPDARLSPYQDAVHKVVWGTGPKVRNRPPGLLVLPLPIPAKGNAVAVEHPILYLVEQARELKDSIENRKAQVQTLQDAVDDYQLQFGIDPPEGFERW